MNRHDEARRAFLKGAALGAGAVAGAGLVPDALAQTQPQPHEPHAEATTTAQSHGHGGHGAFLNDEDAATVKAFAERLMPGATEAGVLNYIDLALAGAYADQQDFYRRGLAALNDYCRTTYNAPFVKLDSPKQDAVITALEEGKATDFTWPSAQAFFTTVRAHTMEGMFADPIYGGNKDFAGWILVGFPGAQPLFSPADMQSKDAFTGAPIIGLQTQSKTPTKRI